MIIQPNSTIHIFKDIEFDSNYRDTFLFNTLNEQTLFFNNLVSQDLTLTEYSYLRHTNNSIKVQIKYENLYNANYMRFINKSHSNKWFYAFITDVEYLNETTSIIYFDIDVIQTWWFDFVFDYCLIEREHTASDEIGEYLLPEDISLGEMCAVAEAHWYDEPCCAVVYGSTDGYRAGQIYSDLRYHGYHADSVAIMEDIHDDIQDKVNDDIFYGVMALTMKMFGRTYNDEQHVDNQPFLGLSNFYEEKAFAFERTFRNVLSWNIQEDPPVTYESYTPHNNKLYTYPYCFLNVDNRSGQNEIYKIENFFKQEVDNNALYFRINYVGVPKPEIVLSPKLYKNVNSSRYLNVDNVKPDMQFSIKYDNFPMLPCLTDTFSRWYSYASTNYHISQVEQVVNAFISPISGAIVGGLEGGSIGAIEGATSAVVNPLKASMNMITNEARFRNETEYMKAVSKSFGGSMSSASNYATKEVGFKLTQFAVRPKDAKRIDQYFDMYGYKTMRVGKPSLKSRRYYNYIKCLECTIEGDIPMDVKAKITQIMKNGITYWHTYNQMHNYNLANTIVGN